MIHINKVHSLISVQENSCTKKACKSYFDVETLDGNTIINNIYNVDYNIYNKLYGVKNTRIRKGESKNSFN